MHVVLCKNLLARVAAQSLIRSSLSYHERRIDDLS